MRLRFRPFPATLALLSLAGPPCRSQQRMVMTWASNSTDKFSSLAKFLPETRGFGYLVVFEKGEEGPLVQALRRLLRMEEVLAFRVPNEFQAPDAPGMATEIAVREHWQGEPRWVVFDRSGRIAANSTVAPNLESLLQAYQEAGLVPYRQRLDAFLKAHPERQDVLLEQCAWEAILASRRLAPLLIEQMPGEPRAMPELRVRQPIEATGAPGQRILLGDVEDARIFGDYVKALAGVLESGAWRVGDARFMPRAMPAGSRVSPALCALAGRYISQVEAELRRHPSLTDVWRVWITLSDWTNQGAAQEFFESIQPVPGDTDFPPDSVTSLLVESFKQRQDWQGILRLVAPSWERWKATQIEVLGGGAWTKKTAFAGPWNSCVAPMLEAYLRQGETSKAQAFLEEVHGWAGSPEYALQAADLAKACNQLLLSERWKALAPAAVQR